ncbi:N-acetylglucosaminyldiphosphoundecaprenol N-acetyl-beta-D-mannosaminyltransferase [Acaryochloris thomasi RCC1774]|uniref:N-acetylglucosaminyldiphosphoundecaprenol N-acetyl-beta-D-mannosaminyltransferase n=1 Tax=Acaryochloris thomasi RCC1774 TaxID=1764569 RepID=A0A2W1JFE6_9CYAN|nr:WecB/TagA/CpsF family glycosyltransferase [Acaryochloris thomasi]PZD72443.1 N-acetylglucosaminyldiphosphoundecaprenol N-acetyl-beta-D-mannosaminyltransferase [Acaryochloris thomasi RCC1774]
MSDTKQDNHRKHHLLGVLLNITSYEDACDRISNWALTKQSCYIIAANVHVVMTAYWNSAYRQVVNHAAMVTPDGMPLVLALRWLGWPQATRVYGPDLMLHCCQRAAQDKLPIYLYGGTNAMLKKLQQNLVLRFPELKIVGAYSPPFRDLTLEEEQQSLEQIHQSGAAIVFVALGCPKQELWMARQQGQLDAVMIGVGAAFGFHSGEVSQAPRWMMALSLEWLYRLMTEPKRLWKRYLINNPAFVLLLSRELLRHTLKQDQTSAVSQANDRDIAG